MKKKVLGICGSASTNSSNLALLKHIQSSYQDKFELEIIDQIFTFPSFRPEFTDHNVPEEITDLRNKIQSADGIIISTPEYVFSIPSGLKNLIEWCVSTTVFSDKPCALITASASGEIGHKELQLIMNTVQVVFNDKTLLLIKGIKSKIRNDRSISDNSLKIQLDQLTRSLLELIEEPQKFIPKLDL